MTKNYKGMLKIEEEINSFINDAKKQDDLEYEYLIELSSKITILQNMVDGLIKQFDKQFNE